MDEEQHPGSGSLTLSDFEHAFKTARLLEESVGTVLVGHDTAIRRVLACLVSGGHLLVEDFPGTGKTTLAKAMAASVRGVEFSRIQFTPDLLPSDVLGVSVYDQKAGEFRFMPGPVFTDILLADEINRASPRTQSALLEAMAEGQATVDGNKYEMNGLFFVVATQNPVEFRGTYPLPEAQMDRFTMQCRLGYVSASEEVAIISSQTHDHPLDRHEPVINREELLDLVTAARGVRVTEEVKEYIVALVSATRGCGEVRLAASPRASLALMRVAQALSLFEGRDFIVPETVQQIAVDVIAHRLVVQPDAEYSGRSGRVIVEELLQSIPVPS